MGPTPSSRAWRVKPRTRRRWRSASASRSSPGSSRRSRRSCSSPGARPAPRTDDRRADDDRGAVVEQRHGLSVRSAARAGSLLPAWRERLSAELVERPGLEVRAGRLTIAGRDAGDRPRARHADLRLRPRACRGTGACAAGSARRRRAPPSCPARAEGAARAGVPRVPPRARSAGERDERRDGRARRRRSDGRSTTDGEPRISHTGTNLSERDLDQILGSGVHLNVDLISQLARVGRRAPGSTIGIRVNPRIGASFPGGGQSYAGDRPTKFGIYPERLEEALAVARARPRDRHGPRARGVPLPDGRAIGRRRDDAARRRRDRWLVEQGCPIVEVNTGGGLGVPFRPGDRPLDLDGGRPSSASDARAARRGRRHRAG